MSTPDPEELLETELALARQAIRHAKHFAERAKEVYWARMDPRDLPWNQACDLVNASQDVAYHATWLANAVERLSARVKELEAEVYEPTLRHSNGVDREHLQRVLAQIRAHSGCGKNPVK